MTWLRAITALFRPARELVEALEANVGNEAERAHGERLALTEQDLASLQKVLGLQEAPGKAAPRPS